MAKPAAKNKAAEELKERGNKAYGENNYADAIVFYSKAIEVDDKNHIYFSNRSACYYALNDFVKAADDGQRCIAVKKDWPKGYFRVGVALIALRKHKEAVDIIKKGLLVDPKNQDLLDHLKEAEQLLASFKVRLGPDGNPLSPAQNAKEDGNEYFKKSQYEGAIKAYSEAISLCSEAEDVEFKATLFSNRAACYTQLYNHVEVVKDTTEAVNLSPNNIKALIRRALALEALEKYKQALTDVEKVLLLDSSSQPAQQCANRIRNALRASS